MADFDEEVFINDHDLVMRQDGVVQLRLNVGQSDLKMGGNGSNGEVHLYDDVANLDSPEASLIRALLTPDFLSLRNTEGAETVLIKGRTSDLKMGGGGGNGEVHLYDADGSLLALLTPQYMSLRNSEGSEMVRIDGSLGDIMLFGADCAELFDAGDGDAREPGTVLVVDDHEQLWPCQQAYDRRVAGIVSGAGGLRPGVVLGARTPRNARVPIALTGKAYCKVDAHFGAIEVGDLLTTSPTHGHAMNASDPARAFGAVIGKALRAHGEGVGLIPVLVALQ